MISEIDLISYPFKAISDSGLNFESKSSCDLDEYKDLQARIEILRAELEEEDDDDDDGGDVVALNR